MAEALAETGAAMATVAASGSARRRRGGPGERRPHPGGRGAAPARTRRPSSSRSSSRTSESPEWKAVEKKLQQAAARRRRPLLRLADRRDERRAPRLPEADGARRRSSPCCREGLRPPLLQGGRADLALTRLAAECGSEGPAGACSSTPAGRRAPAAVGRGSGARNSRRGAVGAQARHVRRRGAPPAARAATSTNAGWVPAVAARAKASPSSSAVSFASLSRSQITSRWSLMKPDREEDDGRLPRRRQRPEVVVDVGLQPRHRRRAAAALPHQVERPAGRDLGDDPLARRPAARPRRRARAGPATAAIDVGDAVRRRDQAGGVADVARAATARAAASASALACTKPGVSK